MPLTDQLVSYFALDEGSSTRVDSVAAANNMLPSAVLGSAAGKLNDAVNFDAGQHLEKTSPVGLDNQNVSWSYWIKPTTVAEFAGAAIMAPGSWATGYGWYFNASAKLRFWVEGYNVNFATSTTTFSTGVWYHVVGTYDATANELKIYVNGSLEDTVSADVTLTFASASLLLTNEGLVDEFGIWSRAISGSEVTTLYGGGTPPAYPFSGGGGVVIPVFMNQYRQRR